ncbi:MAG: methyltransferase domain-containing protein [Acidobacteriota bacterium]
MADCWNPDQYQRFRRERERPFFDLLQMVRPRSQMRVVDLGCGPGNLTRILHQRLCALETVGIDNSETMLERARPLAEEGLRFERKDIGAFDERQAYDLVYSNAALHWVRHHQRLMERLFRALDEGGQLAVQVPANHDHPTHTVASQVARVSPFREALGGYVVPTTVLAPEEYGILLSKLGFVEQHVRLQVYLHRLPSREDVVEWVMGSLLTAYQGRLPADLFPDFLERYRACLFSVLPNERPFLFPFKRILFWARR